MFISSDAEKQSQFKANTKPIKANQTQYKANQSQYKPKTNPIKPNFKGKKMLLLFPTSELHLSFWYSSTGIFRTAVIRLLVLVCDKAGSFCQKSFGFRRRFASSMPIH